MLNFKDNMKYLVNFQIELTLDDGKKQNHRSTYTILESETKKNFADNFNLIKDWFINYFDNSPLDKFIDISKINKEYTVHVKVGRITNSINGKYKTF